MGYVKRLRRESPRDIVTVYVPEYVLGHWWEQLLHNHSALRLKSRLLLLPGRRGGQRPLPAALRGAPLPGGRPAADHRAPRRQRAGRTRCRRW